MDDGDGVESLLEERPELRDGLRAILTVDEDTDTWAFDDVPVDSGVFGELVSADLIESVGEEYRVSEPDRVRRVLDNKSATVTTNRENTAVEPTLTETGSLSGVVTVDTFRKRLSRVDRRTMSALGGALLLLVIARTHVVFSIFRDGAVVLTGNDPYFYRFWVEQLVASGSGPISGAEMEGVRAGEPLYIWTMWVVASLFGGTTTAVGWVLAWYPVLAAVVIGGVLYTVTIRVTNDRRIAVAAVLMLAVTPAHALRTSLGFADHHAFDYLWLVGTVYALVRLDPRSADETAAVRWVFAGLLAVSITGQVLAWSNGPLLVLPVGVYAVVRAFQDVRDGSSPLSANRQFLAGLAAAGGLTWLGHAALGWQSTAVASTPGLLAAGVAGLVATAELAHRIDVSTVTLAVGTAVVSAVAVLVARVAVPGLWAELIRGIGFLTGRGEIAETQSLLDAGSLGWLLLFGFVLVVAVPYLAWATINVWRGAPTWSVPVVYGWYFLLLSLLQVRFAGEASFFVALFAGVGLVHLASVIDVARPPAPFDASAGSISLTIPDRPKAVYLVVLFVLVASLSLVQVPIKISQVTIDDGAYETAEWIDEHASDRGLTYPDNYVLTRWGRNRMYNYFVNGQASSYDYALANYEAFVVSQNSDGWYSRFIRDDVGYIVTQGSVELHPQSVQVQLHDGWGGEVGESSGSGHYQAIYATSDGEYKVFVPVSGATLTGSAPENSTYAIETTVDVNGVTGTYTRTVSTGPDGIYNVTVAYPGSYTIDNRTIEVTAADVRNGTVRRVFDSN